jgi:hypothetical protein
MTPTDTPDDLALPAFEDALWAALRAEHAAQARPLAPPSSTSTTDEVEVLDDDGFAGPPVVVPVDAGRRRHRALRRALAAAAAVAVLGGIGVVASTAGDDGTTAIAGPSTEAPEEIGIEEQARRALDPLAFDSVSIEETYEDGVLVARRWSDSRTMDERTVWYDPQGQPTGELGLVAPPGDEPSREAAWVDHCRRERGTGPLSYHQSSAFIVVTKDLGLGALVSDGREVVDGRELVRLRSVREEVALELFAEEPPYVDPDEVRPDQLEQGVAFYLDAETLLPVAVRHGGTDGRPETEVRITVQPRTAENLQQLVTTGPGDYTEVPPEAEGDGPRVFANPFQGARSC